MTLHVDHGPHLAALADRLAERLADPPADPFEPVVITVPTAGVRDWLSRRLALRLGVTANIAMPFPGRFLGAALGTPLEQDDPWYVERLTWTVLDVLESGAVDVPGWTAARDGAPSRRYAMARRIADLFDRYAANRPQVLQQWRSGAVGDGTVRVDADNTVGGLDPAMTWQFELWRAVRERIGIPSPAERLPELLGQLRDGGFDPALPSLVGMFGVGSLAPAQLDVITALATVREVRVSIIHPSPAGWARTEPLAAGRLLPRRRFDEARQSGEHDHPLTHSWGRLGIETAALVRGSAAAAAAALERAAEPAPSTGSGPSSLLEHVQRDLLLNRPVTRFEGDAALGAQSSIQVHACHGTTRQLEVLRDVLGHLFEADPSLEPRDVLVMCPDLARFEPFAAAVFARGAQPIPLTVTDLSLGTENPVAAALAAIVRTVADRCTAVEVLALAALPPIRQRLGITADDLTRFGMWADRLGTTWGLDAAHRSSWLDVEVAAGCWAATLNSLLLGAAMPAPQPRVVFGDVVPFDDVSRDDLPAAGRLADLVARLERVHTMTAGSRPIGRWSAVLVEVLGLLCATPPSDAWQMADVLRAVEGLRDQSVVAGGESSVGLVWSDVRHVVDGLVGGDPGRLSFRSGRVTMSGIAPVRNVPARVVCLLGFDEASLRPAPLNGDDVLALRPCVGERDRRREQRQVVLDALLAAETHFVVVCDGNDITTNRRTRFPVQLTELLDLVDTTLTGAPAPGDDPPVLVRHPRRAYDERNFVAGQLAGRGSEPFGFDGSMLAAARARRSAVDAATPSSPLRWSIDAPVPSTVTVADLTEACSLPARTLVRSGLDIRLPRDAEAGDASIPLSVAPLTRAAMGRRLFERIRDPAAATGSSGDLDVDLNAIIEAWAKAESFDAANPPGRLSGQSLDAIEREVREMIDAAAFCGVDVDALRGTDAVDVDLVLGYRGAAVAPHPTVAPPAGELELVDTISGLSARTICRMLYQRSKHRMVIASALELAAIAATTGNREWRAVTVARAATAGGKPECRTLEITGDIASARALLDVAAELRVAALRGAVPLFEAASHDLHRYGALDEDLLFGGDFVRGDMSDDETRFVWGAATIAEIDAMHPSPKTLATMLWGAVEQFVAIDVVRLPNRPRRKATAP